MKNWQTRLTETIKFVHTQPVPRLDGIRGQIHGELSRWNTTAPPNQSQILSGLMSRGGVAGRPGTKSDRATQRASILVKCAIADPTQANWAGHAAFINGDRKFANSYRSSLEEAWGAVNSRPAVSRVNLSKLLSDPIGFLTSQKMWVNGARERERKNYGISMRGGDFRFDCLMPPAGAATVQATNIPAVPYAGVRTSLDQIQGTPTDQDMVLTTQFSGCTYCFSKNGGQYMAAHIDPNANPDGGRFSRTSAGYTEGHIIATALRAGGGFQNGNGGEFRAYGRVQNDHEYGYGDGRTIIMAFKRSGAWEVYAQSQNGNVLRAVRIDN